MTNEEIFALPAGPELDGLIDELVFGIDRTANTPEKIRKVISFECVTFGSCYLEKFADNLRIDGTDYVAEYDRNGPFEIPETKSFVSGWIWFQRHGKPYQAALEKYVSAWRTPPTQRYSTDWASAGPLLERLLTEDSVKFGFSSTFNEYFFICHPDDGMQATATTAPLAIARAALLLLRKDKTNGKS